MAAVAQQYYEEAAQNEQMGEEDGVSHHFLSFRHPWPVKNCTLIVLFSPTALPALSPPRRCLRCHPRIIFVARHFRGWMGVTSLVII
jgi:hypothetical protein